MRQQRGVAVRRLREHVQTRPGAGGALRGHRAVHPRGREPGLPLGMGRRGARDLQGQGHHAHAEGAHGLRAARARGGQH